MQIIVNKLITNYLHSNFIIIRQDALMVVSPFTGLAYIDVNNLRKEHVIKDRNGDLWIRKARQKTRNMCNIPLLKIPVMILEKYENHPLCQKSDALLPVTSNQITT